MQGQQPTWEEHGASDTEESPRLRRRFVSRSSYAWGFSATDLAALARDGVRPVFLPRPSKDSPAWCTIP
eukprot:m51a1_g10545 hypothetical protein (69) ;mRNA; f:24866-25157